LSPVDLGIAREVLETQKTQFVVFRSNLVGQETYSTQIGHDALAKDGEKRALSPSDLLTARLWKEGTKDLAGPTSLACPVDIRRHHGKLGPLFFGNAILMSSVDVDAAVHATSISRRRSRAFRR
jgi:hypothetical protein